MATSEITPIEVKREERSSFESPNQQETRMENSPTSDVHKSSEKWPTMKELVDPNKWPAMKELVNPKGPFMRKWKVIFLVSCVFAVLQDPLFLYIPIIINEQDIKCVRSDNKLKIAALVLRSVTDLCYLLNIFFQVYSISISTTNSSANSSQIYIRYSRMLAKAKTLWRSYILIDILAVLPIPQIIILIFHFNTRGSRSFGTSKLMNFFVLVQYVPRVFRIYLSRKELEKSSLETISIWLKGLLSFILFFLASHVLGAFWYFFAIQRITTCWQYGCRNENGCDPNNLDCHDHYALRNITFLNDVCSIHPSNNEMFFDFGIYLDILELGILGSTNYLEKFSNCFWWGLRNLSSLGSNLKPSINTWENLFAVFISIIGFLLYIIYLTGNLQMYVQLEEVKAQRRMTIEKMERMIIEKKKKMEKKRQEVEQWLWRNGIPSYIKLKIMVNVQKELEENKDVDVENILSILPLSLQRYMKSCMPVNRLKQVPLLQNMDEGVLKAISEYLEPVKYSNNDIIIKEKEPLQNMIFIVEGFVIIEMKDCSSTLKRSAGEVYGEKLLSWPAWTSFPALPVATESVKADGDVDALVLMASDIQDVGQKFRSYFFNNEINTRLTDDDWELLESDRVTMLKKVPKLKTMNTRVLKAISENLKPMSGEGNFIIREGKPLRVMVFVKGGSLLSLEKDPARTTEKRQFYGEELLDWVLDGSFPAIVPISTHGVWVPYNTDILVLTANDLGDVVSKFKSYFSKETPSPPDDSSLDLCAIVGLTWLKKEPSIFRSMNEEVLKVISKHLKLMSHKVDTCIVQENTPLEKMFIFVDGNSMLIESTRRPIERGLRDIGQFYGEELVHWVTNWVAHVTFPDKLPLTTSNVKLSINDTGNASVLVLWANDLKSIVSKFRSQFIKQTTLPVNNEGKLSATFDRLATLKKVPLLEDMDQKWLEKICASLIPKRYNDMSPNIIEGEFDKMFLIVSGLVSVTRIASFEKVYHYSGNYCGDELLKRAFHPSRASKSNVLVEAVGEVEALVIEAHDLIRLVSQSNRVNEIDPHF